MSAYSIFIVPYGITYNCFIDIAKAFQYKFKEKGYPDVPITTKPLANTVVIVFGANLLDRTGIKIPDNSIIVNMEQLYNKSMWNRPPYIRLLKNYEIWDYSRENVNWLQNKGITNIKVFDVGYAPTLQYIQTPQLDKDIDILFYGSINPRREKIKQLLSKEPSIKSLIYRSNLYGEDRDKLIPRAKIVLNIHYHDSKIFEIVRVSHLLANHAFIISENGTDKNTAEYSKWTKGVIFCDYSDIVKTCVYYLQHPQLRQEIAEDGHKLIMSHPQTIPIPTNTY